MSSVSKTVGSVLFVGAIVVFIVLCKLESLSMVLNLVMGGMY